MIRSHFRRRRRNTEFVVGWALALLMALACRAPRENGAAASLPLIDLPGQLISTAEILVVPGNRWELSEKSEKSEEPSWLFRNFALVHCVVQEEVSQPLILYLQSDPETTDFEFKMTWDDFQLQAPGLQRNGDTIRIEVPPELLQPGHHTLRMERIYARGIPFDQQRHENVFFEISHEYGTQRTHLEPQSMPRYQRIAEFMEDQVTGSEQEKRSGILFTSALKHTLSLPAAPATRLIFEAENFSSTTARFSLAVDSVQSPGSQNQSSQTYLELAANTRGPIAIDLPDGTSRVEMQVEGPTEGQYLWGAPLLQSAGNEIQKSLPPVVLITLDTTRRDALSPYSGRVSLTPQIEKFARQATVFEQAYSTSPWTLPSHASIFTGLFPSKHRAGVSEVQLPTGSITLAHLLRQQGYLTAGFSAGELSSSRFGLAQGFHHYRNPDRFETPGENITRYVEEFLADHGARPLFLFINYFDPHAIYQAPEEFQQQLKVPSLAEPLHGLPVWGDLAKGKISAWRSAVEGEGTVTQEVMDYLSAAYLAEVAHTDKLVGRLFDRLRQLEIFDRAMIIVTADHGELLGEGGYVSHGGRLDPELVEIPMIIKWPNQQQGERISSLVSLVDLFPTILRVADLEPPQSDGYSIVPTDEASPRAFTILEEHEYLVHPLPPFMKVATNFFGIQRLHQRHLMWKEGQECANKQDDQWQTAPCSQDREQVWDALSELLQLGQHHPSETPTTVGLSDETRERLKALGYL